MKYMKLVVKPTHIATSHTNTSHPLHPFIKQYIPILAKGSLTEVEIADLEVLSGCEGGCCGGSAIDDFFLIGSKRAALALFCSRRCWLMAVDTGSLNWPLTIPLSTRSIKTLNFSHKLTILSFKFDLFTPRSMLPCVTLFPPISPKIVKTLANSPKKNELLIFLFGRLSYLFI